MGLNKIKINDVTTINTGVVYDISKATGQSYETLADALGTDGSNVPLEVREGGMSVRFVHTGDNKYVQYLLKTQSFSVDIADWQGIDELVEMTGVNTVKLEQGLWLRTTGEPVSHNTRVRSVAANDIKGYNYVKCNNEYLILSIVEYGDNGDYISGELINDSFFEYTGVHKVRYTFKKNDDGNISPSDNIIDFFVGNSYILEQVNKETKRAEEVERNLNNKLINLFGIAEKPNDISETEWQIGYVYYDTDSASLRECKSITASGALETYITVPFVNGAIYRYKDTLYIYNGTELVLLTECIYEECKNTYNADIDSGLRNVSSINGEFVTTETVDHYANEIELTGDESHIEVENGSKFSGNYGYAILTEGDVLLLGVRVATTTNYSIDNIQNFIKQGAKKIRISVKSTGTVKVFNQTTTNEKIRENDVRLNTLEGVVYTVNLPAMQEKVRDYGRKLGNGDIELEQGLWLRTSGEPISDSKRVRTKYSLQAYHIIRCNEGYEILSIVEVDSSGTYISGELLNVREYVYFGNNFAKYTFHKITEGAISPTDNIIEYVITNSPLFERLQTEINDIQTEINDIESKGHKVLIGSPDIYISQSTASEQYITTVNGIYDAYDSLATLHPDFLARVNDIGMDASNTYSIRHYEFRMQHPHISNDRSGSGENLWDDSVYKYNRLLLVGAVHGQEYDAMTALYLAIKDLCESNEKWALFIKSNFVIDIIPIANPWGVANNSQQNANGVNLNRDYNSDTPQPETVAMKALIDSLMIKGLVGIIDCHNTGTNNSYIVSNPTYSKYKFYALLAQQLNGALFGAFENVFGAGSHFLLWNTSETGQLHWYANEIGVLGCTHEVKGFGSFPQGMALSKDLIINLINSFGTYYE